MRLTETFEDARAWPGGIRGLVPTMGSLHEGHLSLVRKAGVECDHVVVSLFVNPLQFDDPNDLERYPTDVDRDAHLAAAAGADVLFVPAVSTMYPGPQLARVSVGGLGDVLEGASRPGHFDGVATVVTKLFAGLQPDRAYFGRKDAQQLAVISRMTRDLSFPVAVVSCPTIRDADGLALSSRNGYLDPAERSAALALNRGLMDAAAAVEEGERSAQKLESIALGVMEAEALVAPEYAALVGRSDVEPLDELDRPAFLAVAARVGLARLIDNIFIDGTPEAFVVDSGIRLGDGGT